MGYRILLFALLAVVGAASAQTEPQMRAAENATEYRQVTAGMPKIQVQCAVGLADTGEPVVLCPTSPIEYMPAPVIDAAYEALGMVRPAETMIQPPGTYVPKNWPRAAPDCAPGYEQACDARDNGTDGLRRSNPVTGR